MRGEAPLVSQGGHGHRDLGKISTGRVQLGFKAPCVTYVTMVLCRRKQWGRESLAGWGPPPAAWLLPNLSGHSLSKLETPGSLSSEILCLRKAF
jgi:hypothetical protein